MRNAAYEKQDGLYCVKNFFAHVYRVPDVSPLPPLMTLTYGASVRVIDASDERWITVELISGARAWIQRGDLDWAPRLKTLDEVLVFSKKFLGLTYTWGGTSTYGFDCSGFVQMLFREMGVKLPRNARDQVKSELLCEVQRDALEPGDLIFFGEERITHVGLYLGNGEYIHATVKGPGVIISRLSDDLCTFRAARRAFLQRMVREKCHVDGIEEKVGQDSAFDLARDEIDASVEQTGEEDKG